MQCSSICPSFWIVFSCNHTSFQWYYRVTCDEGTRYSMNLILLYPMVQSEAHSASSCSYPIQGASCSALFMLVSYVSFVSLYSGTWYVSTLCRTFWSFSRTCCSLVFILYYLQLCMATTILHRGKTRTRVTNSQQKGNEYIWAVEGQQYVQLFES